MHFLPIVLNCRLSGKTCKMAAKFLSILKFCPKKKINILLKGLKVILKKTKQNNTSNAYC